MKKINIRLLFWLTLPSMFFASCLMDVNSPVVGGEEEGSVSVKVVIDMPQNVIQPYTVAVEDETRVEEVDVLAFKAVTPDAQHPSGWELDYRARGSSIQNIGQSDKKQFTVMLVKRPYPQHLVVLANVCSEIDGSNASKGDDRDALLKRLISSNPGKWPADNSVSFRPFPMWGEKEGVTVSSNSPATIEGVNMMRAVVRIDVQVTATATANFKLKEVLIYNSKNKGYIVPDINNITNLLAHSATVPTDPQTYEAWNNGVANPLQYDVSTGDTELVRSIYLYEAKAPQPTDASKATCIIIGGQFANDQDVTYYRVDIVDAAKNYKDILRNHHYTLKIVQADGPGYETLAEAFNGPAVNMTTQLINWTDPDIYYIVFDAKSYLGVSPIEFVLPYNTSSGNTVYVTTDVLAGWEVVGVTNSEIWGEGMSVDWITITNGQHGMGKSTFMFGLFENTNTFERTAYIHIKAGRLRCAVKVTQEKQNYNPVGVCGTGGVALLQKIGNNNYLTHEYGGRCWMVQNSMEGDEFIGKAYGLDHNGNKFGDLYDKNNVLITNEGSIRGRVNGYYYTWEQAKTTNNACPAGWQLPTLEEYRTLKTEIDANSSVRKWWYGGSSTVDGAFAGHYHGIGSKIGWFHWHLDGTGTGFWWNTSGNDAYQGSSMFYEYHYSDHTTYWFSVRCVRSPWN